MWYFWPPQAEAPSQARLFHLPEPAASAALEAPAQSLEPQRPACPAAIPRAKLLFKPSMRKRPRLLAGLNLGASTARVMSREAKLRPFGATLLDVRSCAAERGPYLSLRASDPILAKGESR